MAEMITRKLPAGIQFFSIIRKDGYLYVDKTDLVWQLTHSGDLYNYLSRPRRFGKSLLIDTLQCYFEGKKELFDGLKIMELEEEWTEYPVIRLDMAVQVPLLPKSKTISILSFRNMKLYTASSLKRHLANPYVSKLSLTQPIKRQVSK